MVLYEEFYVSLMPPDYRSDYFQAGILGAIYFATAIAIQTLSARLRRTEITSLSRAAEVADLERVNRSIIQRMRTGIIVVDQNDDPRLLNQSARSLLGLAAKDETTAALPGPLLDRLRVWRADTRVQDRPVRDRADHARDPRQLQRGAARDGPTPTSSSSSKTPSKFSSRRSS